jgi:predicted DNA-binding protein
VAGASAGAGGFPQNFDQNRPYHPQEGIEQPEQARGTSRPLEGAAQAAASARPRLRVDTELSNPYIWGIEVHFIPEIQARLDRLATETGRAKDEFVQDAMPGYLDELERTREMIDSRYDDIKSGRVKPIDGEEAFARLREKSEARRNSRQ